MTRGELRRALAAASGEAVPTCMATLPDTSASVQPDGDVRPVPTRQVVGIDMRRARHAEAVGLPALGFARRSAGWSRHRIRPCEWSR